jgi:hypothetical protein
MFKISKKNNQVIENRDQLTLATTILIYRQVRGKSLDIGSFLSGHDFKNIS